PESLAVAERQRLADARPVNTKRFNRGAYQSQGVMRVKAVRHGERVEDAAHILQVKGCLSFIPSTSTLPSGISMVQTKSDGAIPGSYECGPNGLTVMLSIHMKAKAPLCRC